MTSRSRERHRESAGFWADVSHKVSKIVKRMSRVGMQGSDSLVFIVCREPQRGEAPRLRLQEDALEYILEVGTRRSGRA